MQESVSYSLVVSLGVVVPDEIPHGVPEMTVAHGNELRETFSLHGAHKSLGIRVEVRAPCRKANELHAGRGECRPHVGGEDWVAIKDEVCRPEQKAVDLVQQSTQDVLQPFPMRFMHDSSELDHAALQIDDEEDVAASEAAQCQALNREEVGRADGSPMHFQKRLPLQRTPRRGVEPVLSEDPGDGAPSDGVSEVLQGPADPRVVPSRVLLRHGNHECGELGRRPGSTRTPARATVVLVGDELPIPAQQRIGRHDRRQPSQGPSPNGLRAYGEAPAFVVGKSKSAAAR